MSHQEPVFLHNKYLEDTNRMLVGNCEHNHLQSLFACSQMWMIRRHHHHQSASLCVKRLYLCHRHCGSGSAAVAAPHTLIVPLTHCLFWSDDTWQGNVEETMFCFTRVKRSELSAEGDVQNTFMLSAQLCLSKQVRVCCKRLESICFVPKILQLKTTPCCIERSSGAV